MSCYKRDTEAQGGLVGCPRCRKDLFTSIPSPQLLRQMREMRSNCMFPRAVRITFTWMLGELDPSITPPVIVQLVVEPPLAKCCLGAESFVVPPPKPQQPCQWASLPPFLQERNPRLSRCLGGYTAAKGQRQSPNSKHWTLLLWAASPSEQGHHRIPYVP